MIARRWRAARSARMSVRSALAIAAMVAVSSLMGVGGAKADLYGAPNLTSIYVVGHGEAAVAIGYVGWGGAWTAAPNGTELYAGSIYLTIVSLLSYNSTFTYDTMVATHGWVNASIVIPPDVAVNIQVNLPADPNWRTVELAMDGTPWYGTVATPISLLPNSIADVGGLDILALGIISETLIGFAGATAIGAALMRRAIYAPKFSLLIWGHVILIGLAAIILVDFQFVDQTFAGWSPLVYAGVVSPVWLAFVLSYFNRSNKAEILQEVARPALAVTYRRWLIRLGTLPDGRRILIREGWAGFWARVWGAYVVIDDGDPSHARPFEAAVQRVRSPTDTKAGEHWRARHGRAINVDDFKVVNPQDDGVSILMVTDTSEPLVVDWPRLTWHSTVTVSAKISPEGRVIVPEHTERHLTWPHYTEGSIGALRLADEHYQFVAAASARKTALRDLGRIVSKSLTAFYSLQAAFEAKVNARVEAILVARNSLVNRPTTDLTDSEADAEAMRSADTRSLAELMDVRDLPSLKKPEGGG